jgi:16S rRNA (cytidine1402-2'-O)-methyltransferase
MAGKLYIISTPIGNLEDITYRAVATLRSVATIACEDTRQTAKLLRHYGIQTPLTSFHEHNEAERAGQLVSQLEAGDSLALVSDAGTPLVSDPGYRLVRAAIERGIDVLPIPGPCAAISALTASGLPTDAFLFGGFLPAKAGKRRAELDRHRTAEHTLIFYEAPHRIVESLEDVSARLGHSRPVVVAREMTKLHEEFLRGSADEVLAILAGRPSVKGEITLLIGKAPAPAGTPSREQLHTEVEQLTSAGASRMEAIKQVARRHGIGKRDMYKLLEAQAAAEPAL